MKTKVCPKCGIEKPLTADFWQRNRRAASGFHSWCKWCARLRDRERDKIRDQTPHRKLQNKVKNINGRARRAGVGGVLEIADIRHQRDHQRDRCYYCDTPLNGGGDIEHKKAIENGGDNTPENIVISCRSCNRKKAAKPFRVWIGERAAAGHILPETPPTMPRQIPLFEVKP